jgi:circadian clock protein KaiB
MKKKLLPSAEDFATQAVAAAADVARYVLRLYISGTTSRSGRAIANIRKICEERLEGRYELEIVDISLDLSRAASDQIVAIPTLIKISPPPLRRFIGDMSQTERILDGLDLRKDPVTTSFVGIG